jgi:hypothetical protein
MESVGNSGSTLVFSLETVSVYLDTVRFKAPGAEVFSPMRFDTDSLIYMVSALENIAAEVLELAGNASYEECEDIISTRSLISGVNCDEELRSLGARFGWELLFAPERAIMREKELHLSDVRDRVMACAGVVQTLTHLIGFVEGSTVSKAWNTIFENEAKTQLESDEVRCHTKVIFTPTLHISPSYTRHCSKGKWKLVQEIIKKKKIVQKLRFKSLVLSRMDWIGAAPETLAKKFLR